VTPIKFGTNGENGTVGEVTVAQWPHGDRGIMVVVTVGPAALWCSAPTARELSAALLVMAEHADRFGTLVPNARAN